MVNDDTWSTGQLVLAEVVESLGEYQKGDIQNVSPQFIVEKIGINKTMDLNLTEIESLAIFERKTKEA